MTCHHWLPLVLAFATLGSVAARAQTEAPAQYCRRVGTDDTLRAVPATLAPEVRRLFSLQMPDDMVVRTSQFRCMAGDVMVCTAGANLPCGKAKTSRSLPAAGQYCRDHPDSEVVPMVVTGHDTIYRWRCAGTSAVAGDAVEALDARGFFVRFWRRAGQ
jgi:hypothetical protein